MAVPHLDAGEAVARFMEMENVAINRYEEGVRDPRQNWQEEAVDAGGRWVGAITTAGFADNWQVAVENTTQDYYEHEALLASQRWVANTRNATTRENYRDAFAPYRNAISDFDLDEQAERVATGEPGNEDRVVAMAQAMFAIYASEHDVTRTDDNGLTAEWLNQFF